MLEKRNYRGLLLRQGGIRGGNKLNRSVQFKKIVNLSGLALLIWLIWMTIRHPTIWFVTIPAVIATIATNALANWRAEHNQPMTTKVKRQVALHEILLWSVSLGGLAVIICLIWMTIRHPVFWFVTVPAVLSLIWILPRCIDPNWQPKPEQTDEERREYLKRVTRIEP